jgi:hypothetical protein
MSRKRGAKHSTLAVVPLGMKRNRYALDANVALLALRSGVAKQSHFVDLYCLAELCDAMTPHQVAHIKHHCAAVSRLCDEIHSAGYECSELSYTAMEASANLLLEWFDKQPNALIARTALKLRERIAA